MNYRKIRNLRKEVYKILEEFPETRTIWEVVKQRKINEDEWRVAMGYPTKETVGDKVPSWTPPSEVKKIIIRSIDDEDLKK